MKKHLLRAFICTSECCRTELAERERMLYVELLGLVCFRAVYCNIFMDLSYQRGTEYIRCMLQLYCLHAELNWHQSQRSIKKFLFGHFYGFWFMAPVYTSPAVLCMSCYIVYVSHTVMERIDQSIWINALQSVICQAACKQT